MTLGLGGWRKEREIKDKGNTRANAGGLTGQAKESKLTNLILT